MEKRVRFKSRWLPWLLIAPQLSIVLVFFFWPAGQALYQSVLSQDAFGTSTEFVGLENFERLVSELADPIRIILHIGNEIDGLVSDAEAGVVLVALGESEIADAVDLDVGDVVVWGGDHNVKVWRVSVRLSCRSQ